MVGRKGETFDIVPIGIVRNEWDGRSEKPETSRIHVYDAFADALDGVAELDQIQVLWWMHELNPEARDMLQAHPRGNHAVPARGVFALRSPMRPNPIGSAVVEVVKVFGNDITVRGLDALNGSPVIDIKSA